MTTWLEDLDKAVAYHGHLCGGQIIGVRLARKGLELLGLAGQWGEELRDLVVFVEADRCAADAAYAVTGCTVGRRRLKIMPYGKTAMSFLDLNTGRAFRVAAKKTAHAGPDDDLVAFWSKYTDDDIMEWQEVTIELSADDRPGKPQSVAICQECGDEVLDRREVREGGRTLCRACLAGAYYRPLKKGAAT
ncbi:MAG: FmdE family protein [Candidatus Adiutrix sp.]|jgi:formylmethanofuran dehydrogenase subunit E|nr:FmdE family protein [Candidatus Adiutrix sp.]